MDYQNQSSYFGKFMETVTLAKFITDLTELGNVTIAAKVVPFEEHEQQEAISILKQYYTTQILEMPYTAPEFLDEAALWGAIFVYRTAQAILLREMTNDQVKKYLCPFSGNPSPEAIYSIDLTLRHLPDLMHFAKGLAPDDIVVQILQLTALQWPFSSVGTPLTEETDSTFIRLHPSLKYAYVDRIIQKQDHKRLTHPEIYDLVQTALGTYARHLWPGLKHIDTDRISAAY